MQGTGHTCPEQQLTKQTEKSMWHSVQKHQQERKRKRNKKAFGKLFALYTNSKKYYISP